MSSVNQTVLVVEDEPSLVEIYAHWLRSDYAVRTATGGKEALEVVDDTVDVMVLDRIMPGLSGEEVIDAVRDRNLDCMIVLVTAVESDHTLIELGADAYRTKPITKSEFLAVVSQMFDRGAYMQLEETYFDLLSKRATLKTRLDATTVQTDEEYAELETRIDELGDQLDIRTETMGDTEPISLMRNAS